MSVQATEERRRHPVMTIALLAAVVLVGWVVLFGAVLGYSMVVTDYLAWNPLVQEVLMVPAEPFGLDAWITKTN